MQQETVEKLSGKILFSCTCSITLGCVGTSECFLCPGLSADVIQPCLRWMSPFVEPVSRSGRATLREFAKEEKHSIQTHADYMTMLVGT